MSSAAMLRKFKRRILRLSMKGLPRGPHITRYAMYRRLEEVGHSFPSHGGRVLAISRSSNLCKLLSLRPDSVTEANFPEHNLLSLQFPDESFDFVLSDQVLEHVEGNPQQAIDESWRVLRPGGFAVHTTCFINPVHEAPHDYWRFTPMALRLLTRRFNKIVECDGWGNFEAWLLVRNGMRFDGIPHATWHPLHRIAVRNDPAWPIVTWVIAQK